MACKKSELISAVNSFASARATGDLNLINYAVALINNLVDTLEFDPEEDATEEKETEKQ